MIVSKLPEEKFARIAVVKQSIIGMFLIAKTAGRLLNVYT